MGVCNVAGFGMDTAISGFNQTQLQNSGDISLPLDDELALLLGYATGPLSGETAIDFAADVETGIDQWWSAAALTLLPASPPIGTLVEQVTPGSTVTYADTGATGTSASPPSANTAYIFEGHGSSVSVPLWAPSSVDNPLLQPYVIPQSAFSSYAGITFDSTVTIATFAVPPNPWAWKPLVWGQIEMAIDWQLSLSPLIGIEVMLGHPTTGGGGTLVARGFGNSVGGVVTIIPHLDPVQP